MNTATAVWVGIFVFIQSILAFTEAVDEIGNVKNGFPYPVFGSDVNVTCGVQEMEVAISNDYILRHSDRISSVNRLCLGDRTCCADYVNGKLSVRISKDFSKCGNKISVTETVNSTGKITHYKFTNKLIYDGGSGPIARDFVLLNFHCLYRSEMLVTAKPKDSVISSHVIKIKKVRGEIGVFKSDTFDEKYDKLPTTPNSDPVFIKIKIQDPGFLQPENDDNVEVVSVIKQCLIKDAEVEHQIVKDGCSAFGKTEIYSSGTSLESSLKVNLNKIVSSESTNATIRCFMDLCIKGSSNNCQPKCTSRKKRTLNDVIKPNSSADSTNKYFLKFNGEEFTTTIYLMKPTVIPLVESTNYTDANVKPINTKNKINSSREEDEIHPKLLLICIFGGLILILLIVLIAGALLYLRRVWIAHDEK
uniref:uncharacterized protein LOC120348461 n=1 Tax=Styela clava TaxID=7725 RepID=UPI00193A34C0|nr:uncharacterized protein LOC120348461 [Styela clava]